MGTIANARLGTCLYLAAGLLLAGCAHFFPGQDENAETKLSRSQRELMLQSAWTGRPYDALVAAYGPPRMLMTIPGDRPYESVAVYGVRDDVTRCIDAFVVFHGYMRTTINDESTVANYFCR